MFLRSEGAKGRSIGCEAMLCARDYYATRVGGKAAKSLSFSATKVLDFQGLSLFLQLKIPYHPIRVFFVESTKQNAWCYIYLIFI